MRKVFFILLGSLVSFYSLFFNPFFVSKTYAANFGAITTNLSDYPSQKIPRYKKFELAFVLDTTYTNPFNPDEIKIDGYFTTPSNQTLIQPGFYYQNYTVTGIGNSESYTAVGNPVWKIRFTPKEAGTYSYYIKLIDSTGTVNSASGTFDVVSSASSGFVNVSQKNGRYFEYDSGSPFIGLGLNASWWQEENHRITFYQYYLNKMGENKANLARVWMTNSGINQTWIMSVQDKNLGANYNLEEAWAFDYILDMAQSKGIEVLLTIDDVNQYGNNWYSNLYNSANGGPCSTATCIFTNAAAKLNQKRLFRYLVARWGYSPSILSWELFNEIDELQWSVSNWNWQDVLNWHQEMALYIRSIDAHKHMTNTSTGSFKTHSDLYNNLSSMSFGQLHFYYVPGWTSAISDPQGQDMANLMGYYSFLLYNSVTNKPSIVGEWGIVNSSWTDNTAYLDADDIGVHLHNGLWSSLMSGLASTGLSWHWGYHKTHETIWWKHYLALSNYFSGIDVTNLGPLKPFNVTLNYNGETDSRPITLSSSNTKIRAMGLRNSTNSYIWIQNSDNTWWNYVHSTAVIPKSGTVTVSGLPATTGYTLEWWNSYDGTITSTQSVTSDSTGAVQLPVSNLTTDLAVKIIRSGSYTPSPTISPTPVHCLPLGDVNCSSNVDMTDLSLLLSLYGRIATPVTSYDLDDNGKVNILDSGIIIKNFGQHIP